MKLLTCALTCLSISLAASQWGSAQDETQPTPVELQKKQVYAFPDDGVYFSNVAKGARLNNVNRVGKNEYFLTVSPGTTPVNSSAYFAFQAWSDTAKTIRVNLKYTEHRHRYIPKLSHDGVAWPPISGIISSEGDTLISFDLAVNDNKTWMAAQEVFTSEDDMQWLKALANNRSYMDISSAGKSVLGKDIYVASIENEEVKPSVVLVARQHPPEIVGGTIGFRAFYEELVSDSDLAQKFRSKFNIYAFTLINPDGADEGLWRHNANGYDLNRDWDAFSQPETQTVRDFTLSKAAEGKKIMFGIDFHTSFSGPYLIIFQPENEKKVETGIIHRWIKLAKGKPAEITRYNRRDQHLPYASNWFFKQFEAEAVTYEDGDEIDRDIVRQRGKTYAATWMQAMLTELENNAPK